MDSEGLISLRTRSKVQQVTILIFFTDCCLVLYILRSNLQTDCSIFSEFHLQGPNPSSPDTEMDLTGTEIVSSLTGPDLSQSVVDSQTDGTVEESQISCTTGEY